MRSAAGPQPIPAQRPAAPAPPLPASATEQQPIQVNVVAQPVSTSLGKAPLANRTQTVVEAPDDALVLRFTLFSRSGRIWSYPYSYVGLIECPSPRELVIHCSSSEVELIAVSGRGLDRLHPLLATHRLVSLAESEHPNYDTAAIVVATITVRRAPAPNEKAPQQ